MQIGLNFLVPAYPGCPGKRPLNECVCLYYFRKMNAFLDHFESKSKHSTVSREAAAAAAVTANDSTGMLGC